MIYDFNADDVFEMAQQLERNGAQFYRTAAASVKESTTRDLLLRLADMEDEHEKIFTQIHSQLTASEKPSTVFDPQGEAAGYLKALADTRVFFRKKNRHLFQGGDFQGCHYGRKGFHRILSGNA